MSNGKGASPLSLNNSQPPSEILIGKLQATHDQF